MQKMSLMERRKQKLGGLQSAIKNLSVVENELKVPSDNGSTKAHALSEKTIRS